MASRNADTIRREENVAARATSCAELAATGGTFVRRTRRNPTARASSTAPAARRTPVKVAGSIVSPRNAKRHKTEFAANESRAATVNNRVRMGIFTGRELSADSRARQYAARRIASGTLPVMTRRNFLLATGSWAAWGIPNGLPFAKAGQDPAIRGTGILNRILDRAMAGGWYRLPIGELVGKIGLEFIGTPYVGFTLELDAGREFCVVNLEGLDCVTFFENSLGIARALKSWASFERKPTLRPTMDDVVREITTTRYRGGKLGDYTSRLHYTFDWMYDNVQKGTVREITGSLPGAKAFPGKVDYMSTHPEAYRQLRAHPELIERIRAIEVAIQERENLFLPKERVPAQESKLETGDIVGLVTSAPGLDISHTGLIVREGCRARFLHASSSQKKVVLDRPIGDVLSDSKKDIGLAVVRPIWT